MKLPVANVLKTLIPLFLIASVSVAANTGEMDEAVKKYYAGLPGEAIGILETMALAGDVDAQYLLGNILYSLSRTEQPGDTDGAVKWYKMAAQQNSAEASYALGAIFQNRWQQSQDRNEAALAINYYQQALDRGYIKAQPPLTRIKSRTGISSQQAAALVKAQETIAVPISEPEITSQAVTSSENQEQPRVIDNVPVGNLLEAKQEPVSEPETVFENSDQAVQASSKANDEVITAVTLEDFASQCQNYTDAGFGLYAETIRGGLFSGEASLVTIRDNALKPATYSIDLTGSQSGLMVFITVQDVPGKIAARLVEGDKVGVSGIVVESKVVGSNCAVSLLYRPS